MTGVFVRGRWVQKPKFMNQCIIKSLMNELVNIKLKSILRETAHLARPREYRMNLYSYVIHFKVGYSFRPIFSHGLSPRSCSFERRCRGATTSGQFRKHAANCSTVIFKSWVELNFYNILAHIVCTFNHKYYRLYIIFSFKDFFIIKSI